MTGTIITLTAYAIGIMCSMALVVATSPRGPRT